MKNNQGKLYDQNEIDLVKKKTSTEISQGASGWQISAIQYLLSVIDEIKDENESLWFMLEEEKNSKTKPEHTRTSQSKPGQARTSQEKPEQA